MKMFNELAFFLLNVHLVYSRCGIPAEKKILGGQDVGRFTYPWFALFALKTTGEVNCAGSLISEDYILTAAHCFISSVNTPNEKLYDIILGVYDRCASFETTRQYLEAEEVLIHENYSPEGKFFDIALIRLKSPVTFGTWICLPHQGNNRYPEPATVIGFGVTSTDNSKLPCRMMEANITKFTKKQCLHTLLPREDALGPNIFCAGDLYARVDSCYGDSGGPLMTWTKNGRYVISGVVSYGLGCGNPGFPGIYTDVAAYLPWIHQKMDYESRLRSKHPVAVPSVGSVAFISKSGASIDQFQNQTIVQSKKFLLRKSSLNPVNQPKTDNRHLKKSHQRPKEVKKSTGVTKSVCHQKCRCGIPNKPYQRVGGGETPPHKYPWMALLFMPAYDIISCGGTLINDRYVLTAAHCILNSATNYKKNEARWAIKVVLGEHDMYDDKNRAREYYNVLDVFVHENYSNITRDNDVALVKLDRTVVFKKEIGTACLPLKGMQGDFGGKLATIAEWGNSTSREGIFSTYIEEVKVHVLTEKECKNIYPEKQITENMICTDDYTGLGRGDSGGALLVTNERKRMVAIGIATWGAAHSEHRVGLPIVYTNVTRYLDWILEKTRRNCYCL